jgi:4-hydroxybenzoate polyprenyltransferase
MNAGERSLAAMPAPLTERRLNIKAYAQLLRIPNVFTAFADIGLAWAAAHAFQRAADWPIYLLLMGSSGCLYMAGMVWNDFFDIEQDRRERPFRPLPSGRVSRSAASALGIGLLLAGVGFAALAGWRGDDWQPRPVVVAGILGAMVLVYDGAAKRTPLGPVAMGACRFLNVLLGLSVVDLSGNLGPLRWHLALVVGLYIVGVTWFARTEARISNRTFLVGAAVVIFVSLMFGLLLPIWLEAGKSGVAFPYLLVAFAFVVGFPLVRAIRTPIPALVQAAIKRAVLGLVLLDAILATALIGWAGLLLLLLWPPAMYLGRWVYST